MSNLSSIVDKERRFDNVHLFQLADKVSSSVEDKKFIPFDGNRPLKIVAIDQAEDLLLRFIENENEQVHNRTNGDNPNNNPITFASAVRELQHNRDGDNNQPSLQHLHIGERIVHEITLYRESESFSYANDSYIIKDDSKRGSLAMIQFRNKLDRDRFAKLNQDFKKHHDQSTFNQRTDAASASQYFQFYGYLSQQQNMMQDYVRTATYQRAMLANLEDFKDKVVLDVGAGSGILSFFALQAGAKKVYAVEASSMAKHAQLLVQSNNLIGRIEVIAGKIEEVELPEPVDVIISEPMGYMLFNERMLETYLHAKKWLRSSETGRMFPSRGDLHVAPFSDAQLYIEQTNKANFWYSKDFHGVDLRALHSAATNEYFRQPVVDTFDIRICMAKTIRHVVDFQKSNETDLHCISIPLEYIACETGDIHGLAFWFDIAFVGSTQTVWLSTAPSQPLTHWYQVRCLLSTPLWVNKGEQINGSCVLRANKRQSYDVDMELFIKSRGTRSSNTLDLKNPYFRYTGQTVQAPPGTQETSPSEQLWTTFDPYQQSANVVTTAQVPMSALAGQAIPIIQHHQQQPHQHDQQLHQPQQSHQQQTTVHQSIVNNAALMNSGMQSSQLAGTPMNDVGVNFNGIV